MTLTRHDPGLPAEGLSGRTGPRGRTIDLTDRAAPVSPEAKARGRTPRREESAGTRQPRAASLSAGELRVEWLTGLDAVRELVPAWAQLYAGSDLGNANLHPAWVLAWYESFVDDGDVLVAAVRSGEHLVGVAPLWRMRLVPRLDRLPVLQLAGAGRHVLLTDTPGVLTPSGEHRKVTKVLADALAELPRWAWYTLTLSPLQGWSDQFATAGASCVFPRPGRTCVISWLPSEPDQFERGLKRNVRESIRRSVNRLRRADSAWSVTRTATGPGLDEALADVVSLHRGRARLDGHKNHLDVFARPGYEQLLGAAARGPGGADLLTVYRLRVGERTLAAQVVVHAPTTSTLLVSGIHPDGWQFSPMALLTRQIVHDAIAAGRTRLNHSAGPDTGKLRWSEDLETHAELSVVRTDRLSRLAFLAHSHAAVNASLRRERGRQQSRPVSLA